VSGTLFIVPTPLGNLEDVTLRALRVLKEVDVIAAEDTRHSRKLLDHFGIHTAMTSYHDHVEQQRAPRLVEMLLAGQNVALISDAGTPTLADPGYRLVRAAIEAEVRVVPLPGASAITTSLSAAGLPTDRFVFEGFVPAKAAARRRFFAVLRDEGRTIVCFEAGRRVVACLHDLEAELGPRRVVVAREVTKLYEEFARGVAGEVRARLEGQPVRGEVTLLIGGAQAGAAPPRATAEVGAEIAELRRQGISMKEISRRLAATSGLSARQIYRLGIASEAGEKG